MACVPGELGDIIQNIIDEANKEYKLGQYAKAVETLESAWELLPGDKYEYDESYIIVWAILRIAIGENNNDIMLKWVKHILYAGKAREDFGEREMWAGRVAYEVGECKKALNYFRVANQKSGGRCFSPEDKKYRDFLNENKK